VRLQVGDLSRSLAHYETVLGFRGLGRRAGQAILAAHGDDRPLVELTERPGATPAPRGKRLGLFHFAILLPDRASLGRFLAHLGRLGVRAGTADHLVSEAVYLYDPDGLGIEVYADRPRASWRRRGEELAMDTLPLDVAAVIAEGNGESWTGMPAGTVIGHVHLHVGDLERAASFYQTGIGLNVTVRSYPGALFLSAGGYHHHLGLNTWTRPGATAPRLEEAQLLEWEIVVPRRADVDAAAGALQAAGHAVRATDGAARASDPWRTSLVIVAAR
jgi:catechol 2,3-dioxygenase